MLEENLFEVDPMEFKDVAVLLTLLDGEIIYARDNLPDDARGVTDGGTRAPVISGGPARITRR